MAGHSRPKDGVASLAYVPAIHVFRSAARKTWMPGTRFTLGPAEGRTRVPGMTAEGRWHASRRHHHLADHLAILDEAEAFARLFEGKHLVDHRLYLPLLDHGHQPGQIVVVEAVRAFDLDLEAPDVAQVLLRVVARGRPAHQELAAALDTAQRRQPRVAAGEVDDDVDATVVGATLRLAVFLDRPLRPVGLGVVDDLVSAHRLQGAQLLVAGGARDHLGAQHLGEQHAAGADAARRAQHQHAVA